MTKDKKGKSSWHRRKPKKSDCVVFSDNWGVVREYGRNGTSVATPDELGPNSFRDLLGKLTQQKEAGYE